MVGTGSSHLPPTPVNSIAHSLSLTDLARSLVHDLRNPLSSILTALSLVQRDPGISPDSVMLLDIVQKESSRLNRILTEFSHFIKLPDPKAENFELRAAVDAVVQNLRQNGLLGTEVTINVALEATRVRAEEEQIRLALEKILLNAAEAMQHQGRIRITSSPISGRDQPERLALHLSDSGPGFSSTALEEATRPFFSTKPEQTGLGLSLAASIAEAAGGTLCLDNLTANASVSDDNPITSSPKGARVTLILPTASAAN